MYAPHFGLQQEAFAIAPDPRFLHLSAMHREALAHLMYGLQGGGGFVLLTGEIGTGKTTLARCFLEQIPKGHRVAYVVNPRLTPQELMQTVCEEFGIELPPVQPGEAIKPLLDALNRYLLQAHARHEQCLLVVDEAQGLSARLLEMLRLLTNLETSERKLLQIVLIGQPELRDMLERPELEQLAQRVIARYHLQALELTDTRLYVQHRLTVAGLKGPSPFSERALRRIHQLARGVPRRINLLCDRALLGAYAKRLRQVDTALVDLAATEVLGRAPARPWPSPKTWAMGLLALGVMLGGIWGMGQRLNPEPMALVPAAAADAPPPAHATPPAPRAADTQQPPPPSASDTQRIDATAPALASLRDAQNAAWQSLGLRWGLRLPPQNICEAALVDRVQCFRTADLTLAGLRQLNRPGLLLLQDKGVARWVEAEAIDDEHLVLRAGQQRWRQPLTGLPALWSGDYATFWRLPPGQTRRVFIAAPQDPAGQWLDQQLQRLQANGTLHADARDFAARVRAFQVQHGLHGDGKALPSTFLLVNRLTGVDEPRLQTAAR